MFAFSYTVQVCLLGQIFVKNLISCPQKGLSVFHDVQVQTVCLKAAKLLLKIVYNDHGGLLLGGPSHLCSAEMVHLWKMS